jgi:hypothetical protein
MSLGKTFTNAIIREIGRNYGKAFSNKIMGNSHATPVNLGGVQGANASRRKYDSKLDELLQKFTIKGKIATFNQAQNIHLEYFNYIDEVNSDGAVDIFEFQRLANYTPRVVRTLDNIIDSLEELEDDKVEKVNEKKRDILDFRDSLIESFEASIKNGIANVTNNSKRNRGLLLSLISVDRIYFYPREWKSYIPLIFFFYLIYLLMTEGIKGQDTGLATYIAMPLTNIVIYSLLWNPISKGGVWKFIKQNKNTENTYSQLEKMLNDLKAI